MQELRPLIAGALCNGNGADGINLGTDLRKNFRVLNQRMRDLGVEVAAHFGCSIAPQEAQGWRTPNDIIDALVKKSVVSYNG